MDDWSDRKMWLVHWILIALAIAFLAVIITVVAVSEPVHGASKPVEIQTATQAITQQTKPKTLTTAQPGMGEAGGEEISILELERNLEIYTYQLLEDGNRIYRKIATALAGELVKTGECAAGWMRIEFRPEPLDNPRLWKVGWTECNWMEDR